MFHWDLQYFWRVSQNDSIFMNHLKNHSCLNIFAFAEVDLSTFHSVVKQAVSFLSELVH